MAKALNRAGFIVYAADHVGHGQSEGDRAVIEAWGDFTDDLLQFTDVVKKAEPEMAGKIFLLGESGKGERGIGGDKMQAQK